MRQKKWLLVLALVIALTALIFVALSSNQKRVPDFSLRTLNNKQITQQDLQGKVTLVNFWATTCPGCVAEMPMLQETWQKFSSEGYQTLAVAMSYDPEPQVRKFVEKNKLPFITGLDKDGRIADAFGGIQLTPTSVLVDKKGKIIRTIVGVPDKVELHQLIQEALAKS